MPSGRIKEYNPLEGSGTILMEDGQEISLPGPMVRADGREELVAGEAVRFEIVQGFEGPLAVNVRKMAEAITGKESLDLSPTTASGTVAPPQGNFEEAGRSFILPDSSQGETSPASSILSLPKFAADPVFVRLRDMMRAVRNGNFSPQPVTPPPPLPQDYVSAEEMANLESKGLDVEESDVRILEDGTLAYKNLRVVLYIRSPNSPYTDDLDIDESWRAPRRSVADDSGPRFHIANCRTLEKMRQSGRGDRYVVSTRDDCQFEIVTAGGSVSTRSLRVCKNCLEKLDWRGFNRASGVERDLRVKAFSLIHFFSVNGRSL